MGLGVDMVRVIHPEDQAPFGVDIYYWTLCRTLAPLSTVRPTLVRRLRPHTATKRSTRRHPPVKDSTPKPLPRSRFHIKLLHAHIFNKRLPVDMHQIPLGRNADRTRQGVMGGKAN